jgi:hypothetical protein
MAQHLPPERKRNRIARKGRRPRPLAVKVVPVQPQDCSPEALNSARATLVAHVVERLIARGVLVVENNTVRVRHP